MLRLRSDDDLLAAEFLEFLESDEHLNRAAVYRTFSSDSVTYKLDFFDATLCLL